MIGVTGLLSGSVSGFQNPGVSEPTRSNDSPATTINVTGTIRKPTSINTDWKTSVRATAKNPPMNV